MTDKIYRIILKFRYFIPVGFAILISITVITIQSIQNSKKSICKVLEKNLILEVETISKMFEREYDLKLQKVEEDLKIISNEFYSQELEILNKTSFQTVENQITGEKIDIELQIWKFAGKELFGNFEIVDKIQEMVNATSTIFQKIDSGYVRISTNVLNSDSSRAIGTFIPNSSPVVETIEKNETFIGRAFVVNDWYITAYQPIIINEKVVGMLYVGNKEKDLGELNNILKNLKIGNSGRINIVDEDFNILFSTEEEQIEWKNKVIYNEIISQKSGSNFYYDTGIKKIIAYTYFEKFKIYIIAELSEKEETAELINEIVTFSIIIAIIILILLTVIILSITNERLHKYLKKIEDTNENLENTKVALGLSEVKFKTLFDNSSDEIYVADLQGKFIEVNKVACETLGYSREELLNKRFIDIKTEKYKANVSENLDIIKKTGKYIYESEHLSKTGEILNIEIKSKIIDYEGEKVIMSIARNIGERKEIEKKIISTVIKTEEKERKRFAADIHDGLSPILSTIKLYADLLKNSTSSEEKKVEFVKNIDELVDLAISTSKEISNNITPSVLHDFGLAAAIKEFSRYINKTKSIKIEVETENYTYDKRGLIETVLFQASKELINNTIKHASAENIKIELKNSESQIILYYKDDGKGFNVNKMLNDSTGLGLNNIVNKIKTIKGTCDFHSLHGKGMFLLIAIKI